MESYLAPDARKLTLTVTQVAELLGISVPTARRLVDDPNGPLPKLDGLGAKRLVSRAQLDAYLAGRESGAA